jgi:hypothetical protein
MDLHIPGVSKTDSNGVQAPRTEYSLANAGRAALRRDLAHMEALIHRVREA